MLKSVPAWIKDLVVLVVVFGVILGGLFAFTGVWPPAVIVESGSMMHRDSEVSFGRYGTIDPGDMVLVKGIDVSDRADVETMAQGKDETYGSAGDVVIYYPGNNRERTPIIHRAMAWVELTDDPSTGARKYEIQWAEGKNCPNTNAAPEVRPHGPVCVFGSEGITITEFGLFNYKPLRNGLVTKGDNPFTNTRADQASGLSDIVQAEWIEGKARAEIPWLGLIKLAISPRPNERAPPETWWKVGSAYAPADLWIMLGVTLFALIGVPVGYDAYKAIRDRRSKPALAQNGAHAGGIPPLTGDTVAPPPPEVEPPPRDPATPPDAPRDGTPPREGTPPPVSGEERPPRQPRFGP